MLRLSSEKSGFDSASTVERDSKRRKRESTGEMGQLVMFENEMVLLFLPIRC